jgi:hypothetical protein
MENLLSKEAVGQLEACKEEGINDKRMRDKLEELRPLGGCLKLH